MYQGLTLGVGVIAQSGKGLPYKHKDLSSITSVHTKSKTTRCGGMYFFIKIFIVVFAYQCATHMKVPLEGS